MEPALRRNLAAALAAALAACLLGPAAWAEPEAPGKEAAAPAGAATPEDAMAVWEAQLDAARQRIERARERVTAALASYSRARHDRYPRGAALAAIEEERQAAELELRDAESALPKLMEQARREGVPPGVLDPDWE